MRSAIGNSLLLNLVIIFVSLIVLFFVGILSYSKAYRAKNRIVELIEESETYDSNVVSEIENNLDLMGYSISRDDYCSKENVQQHISNRAPEEENIVNLASTNGYNYCVFKIDRSLIGSKGIYYVVVTFVKFEFPVIGNIINIPVYGETKILGIDYDYE